MVSAGQAKRPCTLSGESDPVGFGYACVVLETAEDFQDAFKANKELQLTFNLLKSETNV